MGSSEDDNKKRSITEMFGDDDSDDGDETQSAPTNDARAASGLFDSDSESDADTRNSSISMSATHEQKSRTMEKRIKTNDPSELIGRDRKMSDEYDSGEEAVRTKEDEDFIDHEDDLADVLGEYEQDTQQFDDERPKEEELKREIVQEDTYFDDTLKSLKSGRRSNKMNLSAQDMERITQELLFQMDKAWADDQKAVADSRPALAKIKFVDHALSVLKKHQLQPMLLDFDLLSILKKWIQPLDDGSLPNLGMRTKVIEMVHRLPIYKEHLKRSGFGKVVMALWKHPDEIAVNKELCREMIDRWSRSVFNKTLDYSKLAELEAEKGDNHTFRRDRRPSANSVSGLRADVFGSNQEKNTHAKAGNDPSHRARLPEQLRFDFMHRPQSKLDMQSISSKKVDPDSRRGRLLKRMSEIAKPRKKGKRAVGISIEGR